MELSNLLIRVIFLILPGAIASAFYKKLKGKVSRKDWEDLREIVIFSVLSYSLYGLCTALFTKIGYPLPNGTFTSFQAFFDEKIPIEWHELLYASIVGILLSVVASYVHRYKLITRFGAFIGATQTIGDDDVWEFFHNAPDVWVDVRDHKHDLVYECWIQVYSDPYQDRELLLRDVKVYRNSTGEYLYDLDAVYLSRSKDELTIEVRSASNGVTETQPHEGDDVSDEQQSKTEHRRQQPENEAGIGPREKPIPENAQTERLTGPPKAKHRRRRKS